MDDSELFYYTKDTIKMIKIIVKKYPDLEDDILELADLARHDGADNATNGYGYPVR
jgi:hypothetical protein